jgi:hypothetical protein
MTRLITLACLAIVALVSAACAGAQQQRMGTSKPPVRVKPDVQSAQGVQGPAVTGEVPADDVEKLRAEVASKQGVAIADVKVLSAQAVNWPNGALGCPQPGRMYTQAIVPGYRVELEAGGKRFSYHASAKGSFKLCESRLPSPGVDRSRL